MNIHEAIIAHLNANPRVAAVLGNRIYPNKLPQESIKPAAAIFTIDSPRTYNYDEPAGVADTRIELRSHGKRREDAAAASEVIRQALSGFSGMLGGVNGVDVASIFVEDQRDGYDDELELFTDSIDVMIDHAET